MDMMSAWLVARVVAGMEIEGEELEGLPEPWKGAAEAARRANGMARVDALRVYCDALPDGKRLYDAVLEQNPRRRPAKNRPVYFEVPPLPRAARLKEGLTLEAAGWLGQYTDYAKKVSPRTPELFHVANGLWLVSLAVARRLVLRLAHKDLYPNLAILEVAQTTLYAKTTGMNIPRYLATLVMRYLLLPGAMTPEETYNELGGQQPVQVEDVETWQRGRAYAGQRGVCLDEASSLFTGLRKDYNIGMSELLCRLYDCTEYDARQTRGLGRVVVNNAYWSFLGATTPWHLKQADVDALWHTGLWPRFLLLTPPGPPEWKRIERERMDVPSGMLERVVKLLERDLPESKYGNPAAPVGMALGEGVFYAFERYCEATMHTLIVPPSTVDTRLYGVYGRLPEQALKVAMLLAALKWNGNGVPIIELQHWAWGQRFAEQCRESAHRLTQLMDIPAGDNDDERILARLCECYPEWMSARGIYKPMKMRSSVAKAILGDLVEAGLVEERQPSTKRWEYRVKREEGSDDE